MMGVIVQKPLAHEENQHPWRPTRTMCWCKKLVRTASLYGGGYHRCAKARRENHLTCWWHRGYEPEALIHAAKGGES